jgi:hypothetical protein
MAKRQVVSYSYTCDVCGDPIPESDVDTASRKVSWEGTDYVIDVCAAHGSRLGELLGQLKGFVDAGNRAGARRGRRPGVASSAAPKAPRGRKAATSTSTAGTGPKRDDLGNIRSWARANGHTVNERGRVPAAVLAAYDDAHSAPAPAPASAPASAPAARKRSPRKKAAAAAG